MTWWDSGYEHDGDGKPVIEKAGFRAITSSNPPPMVVNTTKYQVWSSVLGSSLTTVSPQGNKIETKVFAGGTHIATQNAEGASSPNEGQMLFHTADPVTGTVGTFAGTGSFTDKEEYEPLGQQIETTDPDPYPATYADWHGMGKDPEWQCLAWEEFRSGDFRSMPVHCQKKIVQGGKFSIPAAFGYSDSEEDPQNVTEPPAPPSPHTGGPGSPHERAMSYTLAATSKPDDEDDDDDDEGIGCDPKDPNNPCAVTVSGGLPLDLEERLDASVGMVSSSLGGKDQLSSCVVNLLAGYYKSYLVDGRRVEIAADARFVRGLSPVPMTLGLYNINYNPEFLNITNPDLSDLQTIAEELQHGVQFIEMWINMPTVPAQTVPRTQGVGREAIRRTIPAHRPDYSEAQSQWKVDYVSEVAKNVANGEDPFTKNQYEIEARERAREIVKDIMTKNNLSYADALKPLCK